MSKIWKISQEDAHLTIENITQRCVRQADPSMKRNYSTNDRMLRHKRLDEYFYMDAFFATKSKSMKSLRQNTCFQLFVTDKSYVYVCPFEKESDVLLALKLFDKDVGVPETLVTDGAKAETSAEVKIFCINIGTTLNILEHCTPWANLAELHIGILKSAVSKDMTESNSPIRLWDYCVERVASVHNMTSRNIFKLQGLTPHTALTEEHSDISNLCQFGWF